MFLYNSPIVDMFKKAREGFLTLRPPVRALVFLYWIYALVSGMVGVFAQLFLYQQFTSISLNIVATMLLYTGIMAGFVIPGFAATVWRLNMKHGFLLSFFVTAGAILFLLQTMSVAHAYAAMFIWGVGQGLFWLTVNTFELSETVDEERDFYSSVLNAGNQILSLVGPATATLLIWLSGTVFHLGTYTLLFTVAPVVYLLGFFCFAALGDYRPPRLALADVRHYFTDRTNQAAQLYTLGGGVQQMLGTTVPPLVILAILGTALKVGLYDTVFAIFSALVIIAIAKYRTRENRLAMYGWTTGGLALTTVFLGAVFNFAALVVYTILKGILSPIRGVSSHVIDLEAMELGRKETDFYATMILRDFFLWVWRIAGGFLFLGIIGFFGTAEAALAGGLYLLAAGFVIQILGAAFFMKESRR